MRSDTAAILIIASLVAQVFGIPLVSAAVPHDPRQGNPIGTSPELNMTGADIVNHSIPSRYEIGPTPIDIRVGISDTSLPGPKGEMAAGPRTIGFSADPLIFMILVLAITGGSAGVWYMIKRKPEEPDDMDDEIGE